MGSEDDVAGRFFALWSEYMAALIADPKMAEPARRWLDLAIRAVQQAASHPGAPNDGQSPSVAAAVAGASGERDRTLAELARRIDELGERVAALERGRPASRGARPRNRAGRS